MPNELWENNKDGIQPTRSRLDHDPRTWNTEFSKILSGKDMYKPLRNYLKTLTIEWKNYTSSSLTSKSMTDTCISFGQCSWHAKAVRKQPSSSWHQ